MFLLRNLFHDEYSVRVLEKLNQNVRLTFIFAYYYFNIPELFREIEYLELSRKI